MLLFVSVGVASFSSAIAGKVWMTVTLRLATIALGARWWVVGSGEIRYSAGDDLLDESWRGGIVYYNASDSRGKAERPLPWESSPNMANPLGWGYLASEILIYAAFLLAIALGAPDAY